jgi:hypothetical protein
MSRVGIEAIIPNPALKPFEVLVGKWKTHGSHPLMPGVSLHGHTTFEWTEGGSFLIMRSEIDEPGIPSGVAIIGSDDAMKRYFMLYFDERGISRQYEVSIKNNKFKWWREAPGFSQRMTGTISSDGKSIVSNGELSKDGKTWDMDLQLDYSRID